MVSLGIIYGDIGTSPLYVLDSIAGNAPVDSAVILGALSLIFWTLTFQTTLKYIVLTLQADNHGEGGIFSLYALVRSKGPKWLIFPAILGGSALLADGIITPPISVSSAIEGLRILNPNINTIPIVIAIITALFVIQRMGTDIVGKFFGPVMMIWFLMIGMMGFASLSLHPDIFKALNPQYGIALLVKHPGGFWLLSSVFLCTTGAEALYSDLGHCGRANIRVSWVFVKAMLLLSYFGQGAWLISHEGVSIGEVNPFYEIMPKWFLLTGIMISTTATVVASQALISGSFTLINEAIRLNFWPRVRIKHPTNFKGQLYVPSINWLLLAGCVGVVLYFKESSHMEAAYGLAIVMAMIMTTTLLVFYLHHRKVPVWIIVFCVSIYVFIEGAFMVANMAKFTHGGWITLLIAGTIVATMFIYYKARKIRNKYLEFVPVETYIPNLLALSQDERHVKFASNLVYLTSADQKQELEARVLYSLFHGKAKKADTYWFLHIDVVDEPYTMRYDIIDIVPDKVIKVDFKLGFRLEPRVGHLFNRVQEDLVMLHKKEVVGDFRFVVLDADVRSSLPGLKFNEKFVIRIHSILKRLSLSDREAFGLSNEIVFGEKISLLIGSGDLLKP